MSRTGSRVALAVGGAGWGVLGEVDGEVQGRSLRKRAFTCEGELKGKRTRG